MENRASFQDYAIVACGTVNLELNYLKDSDFLDARKILDISDEMLSQSLKRCREYPNMSFEKQRIECHPHTSKSSTKCSSLLSCTGLRMTKSSGCR